MSLREEVIRIALRHPELSLNGFRTGDSPHDPGELLNPDEETLGQVGRAMTWLAQCVPSPRISRRISTYGYKHQAERWRRAMRLPESNHISTGAMIVAAMVLGIGLRRCGLDSANAYLAIGATPYVPSNRVLDILQQLVDVAAADPRADSIEA